MFNLVEFQKDIDDLRELSSTAPFVEYQKVRDKVIDFYRSQLPKAKQAQIEHISDLYEVLVRTTQASSVYTPPALAKELFDRTPRMAQVKILDCSGGTGNLAKPFLQAGLTVTLMDTDPLALKVAALENKGVQILQEDFLNCQTKWDIIIGNPPYQGHKMMTLEQKIDLKHRFGEVMDNKADLYYAFFAKAWQALNQEGILSFIVSRYWLESESATGLRRYLLSRFRILFLHDWYGDRPFGAGVDPLLIVLKKEEVAEPYKIPVIRQDQGSFEISSKDLSAQSMKLLTNYERLIRTVILKNTDKTLGQAGEFHQGIITGFDKAFITTLAEAACHGIERELLVPWIKSSDLHTMRPPKCLIYAGKEAGQSEGFMKYIQQHKERLSTRREVKTGKRDFYELQWGRRRDLFESRRILFAYKAPASRFVICEGVFHSADVYSYTSDIDKDWLCRILNSPIYDMYIKTELKKLGRDLYEYYPHRLKDIRIPDPLLYPDPLLFLEKIEKEIHDERSRNEGYVES